MHVEYLLADALTIASGVHLGAVAEVEPDRLHHRAPPRLAGSSSSPPATAWSL